MTKIALLVTVAASAAEPPQTGRQSRAKHHRAVWVKDGWVRGRFPCVSPNQPAMQKVNYIVHRDVPRARAIAEQEVSLPIHPYMSDTEVERVFEAVESWQEPS